ncbi:hypothetical protein ACFL3P_03560 [Pseudomonadota bacterium]
MKHYKKLIAVSMILLLGFASVADAAKSNWKKGRIYYRMVCTSCHAEQERGKISPAEYTKAEWADYFEKNVHGPQDGSPQSAVNYFVSSEYRESIKDTNRAAKKMLKVPEDQLLEDVKAFVVHGAKDSDQPSRCE